MKTLAIFFIGIAVGSMNPLDPGFLWGWLIPMGIGILFFIIATWMEYLELKGQLK